MTIQRVLIVGGTHGNEWTGITIVQHYSQKLRHLFPNLELEFILANPEAYSLNKRFKDEDLNRAFQFLHESREHSYEHHRAHELKKIIQKKPTIVIDLHTTTANMGQTIILADLNPFNKRMASFIQKNCPETKVICSPDPQKKFLVSQAHHGLIVEVGPIANGIIDSIILNKTYAILEEALKFISAPQKMVADLEVYEEVLDIYYPKDDKGNLLGMIHPKLQNKDFQPVQGIYTPFLTFTGEEIKATTQEELFPIFINEAAYYPQSLAFTLCRKTKILL